MDTTLTMTTTTTTTNNSVQNCHNNNNEDSGISEESGGSGSSSSSDDGNSVIKSNVSKSSSSTITTLSTESIESTESTTSNLGLQFNQFATLLWKCLLIRRVHYISTILELISPLILVLVTAWIYQLNPSSFGDDDSDAHSNHTSNKNDLYEGPVIHWRTNPWMYIHFNYTDFLPALTVLYAPQNNITTALLRSIWNYSSDFAQFDRPQVTLIPLANETVLNEQLERYVQINDIPTLGVYFLNSENFQQLSRGDLRYRLRLPGDEKVMSMHHRAFPWKNSQKPMSGNDDEEEENDVDIAQQIQGNNDLFYLKFYQIFVKMIAYIGQDYLELLCGGDDSRLTFIIEKKCSQVVPLMRTRSIALNQMPYPRYRRARLTLFSLYDFLGLMINLSYVLVTPLIVKRITDEKSTKVKELLRLIGLPDAMFWCAHFCNYFVLICVHSIAITVILFAWSVPVFESTSWLLFITYFLLYGVQLILFSMLLTTVFNRPVIATIVTTLLWIILPVIVFRFLIPNIGETTTITDVSRHNPARVFTSFLPSGSLIWFISMAGVWENLGTGLTFSRLSTRTIVYGSFKPIHVLICMILSCGIYVLLIWYLDNVWPFQYGVPKSPFFPFKLSYWRKQSKHKISTTITEQDIKLSSNNSAKHQKKLFETDPGDLSKAIQLVNVCKAFKPWFGSQDDVKVAVKQLNFNIYHQQITVLLGHNGAGKSTTMNMITGMFSTTTGNVYVNGYDVGTQTTEARRSIGLCPQDNIIFNELTVRQHLRLFARLKASLPPNEIESEIDEMLKLLQLESKANVLATKLSGGMKRKLSLGIALIGGTKILILDEPTTGMDPDARRSIWDLLLRIRRQRAILLTTHYMEEADILGDRIAILHNGSLHCVGSPFFLKSLLGTGYRLRIAKQHSFDAEYFLTKIIRHHVPKSSLSTDIETEVIYHLESCCNGLTDDNDNNDANRRTVVKHQNDHESSSKRRQLMNNALIALFDDIERNKHQYGVESCGLSYATLEDVFLSVAQYNDTKEDMNNNDNDGSSSTVESNESNSSTKSRFSDTLSLSSKDDTLDASYSSEKIDDTPESLLLSTKSDLITGFTLWRMQLIALLLKRIHYTRRYWPMFALQLVIPTIIVVIALILEHVVANQSVDRMSGQLWLNVAQIYGDDTQTFYYSDNDEYNNNETGSLLQQSYQYINTRRYHAVMMPTPTIINTSGTLDMVSISKWILNQTDNQLDWYIQKYLYGLGVIFDQNQQQQNVSSSNQSSTVTPLQLWFNTEQYHSLPLSMMTLIETLTYSVLGNTFLSIESVPIMFANKRNRVALISALLQWLLTCLIFLPIAFPFLASSYILYPIREHVTKSKLLQLMSGVSLVTFWTVNFLFDLLNHLVAISLLYLVIYAFDSEHVFFGSHTNGSGGVLFLLLLSFGVGTIPIVYALSYHFDKPSTGFVLLLIIFFLVGFIGNFMLSIVDLLRNYAMMDIWNFWFSFLATIFRVVPIFSMLFGYQKVQKLSLFSKLCFVGDQTQMNFFCTILAPQIKSGDDFTLQIIKGCCPNVCDKKCYLSDDPFAATTYGAGIEVIYMLVEGFVCFVAIVTYEAYKQQIGKLFASIRCRFKTSANTDIVSTDLAIEDQDVVQERQRIELNLSTPTTAQHDDETQKCNFAMTDLLTVDRLMKRFDTFTAVEGLTFGVHHNECFGLLGVNGAGKTTTIGMLTGDLIPSYGDAYITSSTAASSNDAKKTQRYHSLITNMRHFQRNIGYCPQFDALLDRLTGEETLYLYARLRGVPHRFIDRDVHNLIRMVDLQSYAKKQIHTYSGGNRRKLSLATALVGNPSIIILDEPSAGVDPVARRKIWQTLGYVKRHLNTSIVLTSHSMEECEALCSRIGIMVNGQFQCMGSTQHLRFKFGQGYTITISLRKSTESNQTYMQTVHNAIVQTIPSASLKDSHQSLIHYHVVDPTERWSNLFRKMSQIDEQFDFEDYLISDTSLEQIFIMFARHQRKLSTSSTSTSTSISPTPLSSTSQQQSNTAVMQQPSNSPITITHL